ncbi:MAG: puo 1 [Mucilaginibacter sp.]|nr:puo 1 [Mucilaginibacter sp.]
MNNADILIIGAGAAGLMAAYELSKAGKKVIILEALDRIGGRAYTLHTGSGLATIELGAEFVHGDLPITLGLLKEAGIKYNLASASMWQYQKGEFTADEFFIEHWDLLITRLNQLKQDMSINAFMQREFSDDKYETMRESVRKYVSGYDTADPQKASCFALLNEWQHEDESAQHRIVGGYGTLMNYLANECKANSGEIHLNTIVKDIYWEPGKVSAITTGGIAYHATKMIVAVPPGVLQAPTQERGAIAFHPLITEHSDTIQQIGFGSVIKILLEFDEAFWENEQTKATTGHDLKDMGFLLSDEDVPTWWTQFPERSTLLTGWLGGPEAEAKKDFSEDEILMQALQSISNIFKLGIDDLKQGLRYGQVVNWTTLPFTRGSYAYDKVNSPAARKILNNPVNSTVFFAGEYLYDGPAMGTVEAAFTSGKYVAERMLK